MNEENAASLSPNASQLLATIDELTKRHRNGAAWFFWIAGLSLVNTIASHGGSDWGFILGLGITQVVDGIAHAVLEEAADASKSLVTGVAVAFDLVVIGIFVLWGVLARKGMGWAYIVGMVLFGLDTLLLLLGMDILGIVFHIFALFCIFNGFKAHRQLQEILKAVAAAQVSQGQAEGA